MRRLAPLVLAVALASAGAAQAPADSARTVTIPAPEGPGVIYYRAGERPARHARPVRRRATPQASEAREVSPLARRAARAPRGLSRLDLVLLEQSLLRALDERLAGLDRRDRRDTPLGPDRSVPIVVAPGAPAPPDADPPAVAPPDADRPVADGPPGPPAAPETLVTEIERAILDTGLFRTTRVHFEFGEAGILPVSAATLDAVADVLGRYPALRVRIGGHTDAVSSDAFNLALSQRRAAAVADALVGRGVAAGRLEAVGFGEARPVASNETETGRALNRRVEFEVLNPEAATRERRTTTVGDLLREELQRLRDGQ